MGTATLSKLPSIALWQGLQSRALPIPGLISRVVTERSASAQRRASALLVEIASLATLLPALRLVHYCRECDRLLLQLQTHPTQWADSGQVLVHAALRLAASAQFSTAQTAMHLFDSASLDELRLARGKRALGEQNAVPCPITQNASRLREMIAKRLVRRPCLPGEHGSATELECIEHDLPTLQQVAALEAGSILLDEIDANCNLAQDSLQRLRLEIYCQATTALPRVPDSFYTMRRVFAEQAADTLLQTVCTHVAELLKMKTLPTGLELPRCQQLLHQVSVCLSFIPTESAQAAKGIVFSGQAIAAHLRCWLVQDREACKHLCLCLLALERQLMTRGNSESDERLELRAMHRLKQRVMHYIRLHRYRQRREFRMQGLNLGEIACIELQSIYTQLFNTLGHYRHPELIAHEDTLLHNLVRLKGIALYLGEVALYEILWGVRELTLHAIERQFVLSKPIVRILLRALAYALRCADQNQRKSDRHKRVLVNLIDALRTEREIFFLSLASRVRKVCVYADEGKEHSGIRLATVQLPNFLAQNIKVLIREPENIYECQSVQEFVHHSSRYLLELNFLATGARALQVHRVAVLSEVMAEVYRALHSVNQLPSSSMLKQQLQAAHRCLRDALNQAAARQSVRDVRPMILSLYHFLESLYEPPEMGLSPPDRDQPALSAINALAADLRAFTDVFVSLTGKGTSARLRLANAQLRELHSTTRQLQEDLTGRDQVHIGRLRGPLLRLVGRLSNERGKQVRLFFVDNDVHAPRQLLEHLQPALENLLKLLLENSIEHPEQRRKLGRPDTAGIHIRAIQTERALNIWIEDDGAGLTNARLAGVERPWLAMGAHVALEPISGRGCRIQVSLPL